MIEGTGGGGAGGSGGKGKKKKHKAAAKAANPNASSLEDNSTGNKVATANISMDDVD
jgi:hypothetical protein